MSAAAVTADVENATPAVHGKKKKLLLIGGVVLLVLLLAGGGAVYWMKAKAAHAAEADDDGAKAHDTVKADPAHPPAFLPLDPFVVNLADTDADKYAQVGITLELETPVGADQLKAYMPAVRNAILLILAQKTSQDLHDRPGKERLAEEIRREAVRPMGIEAGAHPAAASKAEAAASHDEAAGDDADDETPAKAKTKAKPKKAAAKPSMPNPIRRVHFSSFIVQ